MNKSIGLAMSALMLSIVCTSATAYEPTQCIQQHNAVTFTGLDGYDTALQQGSVYLSISGGDNNCGCSFVRFYPTKTDTDAALSLAMAAKLSGSKVRIDLTKAGDCDSAHRIYIE